MSHIFYNHYPHHAQGRALAIGNFDGIHQGHQALIQQTVERAKKHGCVSSLLSFEPHPRLFFNPNQAPFQLCSTAQKARLLDHFGMDEWLVHDFNEAFASLSAQAFIEDFLVASLQVKHVIIGDDFRFGDNREGDVEMLQKAGNRYGFDVHVVSPVENNHHYTVSSTMIRDAIRQGNLKGAQSLLAWPYDQAWEMEGEVVHGDKRGRELGYPTANMNMGGYVRPLYGVYAVRVALDDNSLNPTWLPAVANIGIRPMFEIATPLCEVFIFDFNQEIYGKIMRVQLVDHLRGEKRFDSLEALIAQMDKDSEKARTILGA